MFADKTDDYNNMTGLNPLYNADNSGEKGFKRLWKEGRVFYNAEYTFSGVDRASAIAAIYSGTTPSMNGIISHRWMDASTLRPVNSTDDTAFMGYYTDQTCSPSKLLTSTIADELKIATQGKGLVYAIAPKCDAAILAAGHAGNGAFWLNENSGKWCSTDALWGDSCIINGDSFRKTERRN